MLFIGEISALVAAFLWSNSSIVFTAAAIRIGSIQLNIDRMLLAAFYLIIVILIFQIDISLSFSQFFLLAVSGIIGLIIGDTAIFKSFAEIGPRFTMLFYSLNPAIAALFSWIILDEKLSRNGIIGMFITIVGIAIVALAKKDNGSKFSINSKGVFYGIMSAVGQGVGLVFAKMAYSYGNLHSLTATVVRISSSVIVMLIISLIIKRYNNPIKLYRNDVKSFKLVALGSVIGPFLGITLSFVALEHTSVGIAATLMSTTPIMLIPLSKYYYKENIHISSIVGTVIAVLGIALLFLV